MVEFPGFPRTFQGRQRYLPSSSRAGMEGYDNTYATENVKLDRDIVLATVTQDGRALNYAADELKTDREIILTELFTPNPENIPVYKCISIYLWGDKEITLRLIGTHGYEVPFTLLFVQKNVNQNLTIVWWVGRNKLWSVRTIQIFLENFIRRHLIDISQIIASWIWWHLMMTWKYITYIWYWTIQI